MCNSSRTKIKNIFSDTINQECLCIILFHCVLQLLIKNTTNLLFFRFQIPFFFPIFVLCFVSANITSTHTPFLYLFSYLFIYLFIHFRAQACKPNLLDMVFLCYFLCLINLFSFSFLYITSSLNVLFISSVHWLSLHWLYWQVNGMQSLFKLLVLHQRGALKRRLDTWMDENDRLK